MRADCRDALRDWAAWRDELGFAMQASRISWGSPELPSCCEASMGKLLILMITAFVDMVGFAMVLPLVPFYATRMGRPASSLDCSSPRSPSRSS